jgi:hypothetical protein
VHPKLGWVEELRNSLALAMGSSISVAVEEPADPLKKLVVLTFGDKLLKGDYKPLQQMAHHFAKANNCVLERIRRRPGALVLEVLVKTRLGPVSDRNPLKE